MSIELKDLLEITVVVLTLKLIVSRWQPPVQESIQALICILIGTTLGMIINFSVDGFVVGVLASGVGFYGKDLINQFTSIRDDLIKSEIVKEKIEEIADKNKE